MGRYLDASLVKCDVDPWYVRVTVRAKVLQLVLLEEVRPGQATARRSQTTGHLLLTMPKVSATSFCTLVHLTFTIRSSVRSNSVLGSESSYAHSTRCLSYDMILPVPVCI